MRAINQQLGGNHRVVMKQIDYAFHHLSTVYQDICSWVIFPSRPSK